MFDLVGESRVLAQHVVVRGLLLGSHRHFVDSLAEQLEQKISADPTRATEPGLRLAVRVIRATMDPPRGGLEA